MTDQINLQLISLCLSKNREAQRKLYNLLLPYLNVMCKRYLVNETDIKDVLQETFINIFKNLEQFDLQKASFKTWTTKIAINNCLKKNAKNNRNATEELKIDIHDTKVTPDIFENISNEEMLVWLKKMPQNYFEVFNMFVIDELSHDEIAKFLNINSDINKYPSSSASTNIESL